MGPRPKILSIFILVLFACEPVRVKIYTERTYPTQPPSPTETPSLRPSPVRTYAEAVSQWKSYQDLVKWFENDFALDAVRFKKFERTLPPPRTPEETFNLKSGIYIDAATFAKETLNRIDPSYRAKVVVLLIRPNVTNHYVCSFVKNGKLFIIDYGTPYQTVTGIHGPYDSLEEFKRFYEENHPMKKHIEAIRSLP